MSSIEPICPQIAAPGQNGAGTPHSATDHSNPARCMSSTVAHELNNVLTVIQGYADRLLVKHHENPALQPQLQMISDSARRASALVRDTAPRRPSPMVRCLQPVNGE